jgi:hypothetical protein
VYTVLHIKHPLFLSDFNGTEIFHLQVPAEVMAAGMIMYGDNGNKENVAYSCIIAQMKYAQDTNNQRKLRGEITHKIC